MKVTDKSSKQRKQIKVTDESNKRW